MDNELVDVSGALQHLTNLKILMLQSNQLTKLEDTVREFKYMQGLEILNLSKNPLAQESEYRHYTIFHIPSLKLLDRREVKKSERDAAFRLYHQERRTLLDTIAFGRRWENGPPQQAKDAPLQISPPLRDLEKLNRFEKEDPNELPGRADRRSLMQYSHFDWSKVPRAEEQRLKKYDTTAEDNAQIVTVRFR